MDVPSRCRHQHDGIPSGCQDRTVCTDAELGFEVPFDCTAEAVLPMVAKSEKEAVAEVLGSEENGRYLLEPGHYEVSYQLSGWKEKTAVCVE